MRLANRAVAVLEALPPDAENRQERVDALADAAADLVAPLAAEAGAAGADAPNADLHAEALTLLGWANFHRGRFAEAAAACRTVVEKRPDAPAYHEALTLLGVSLARTGDAESAEVALRTAWKQLAPEGPAPAGAESAGPLQDAWVAGLERARLLAKQPDRAADAGEAYAELYEKFPQSDTGSLLWEWGTALYAAKRYDDADAVYAELVERVPDDRNADRALFILAEGDLVAKPPRPADAVRRFRRLVDPAPDEPVVADDATVQRAVEPYLTALTTAGDFAAVVAAAGPLAERFPETEAAAVARLLAAEARIRLATVAAAGETPEEAANLRTAARADLADARAALAGRNVGMQAVGRPIWASRAWILGADQAFLIKDYDQVDRLAAELEAWRPPPPDLYEMREIHARRFKQQAIPDFDRAEKLALSVVEDTVRGTVARDRAQALLADIALLRSVAADEPRRAALLTKARDIYLTLSLFGSTDAFKRQGSLKVGEMDERLGDVKLARTTYQKLIDNYPGSDEAAAAAKRLAALPAD